VGRGFLCLVGPVALVFGIFGWELDWGVELLKPHVQFLVDFEGDSHRDPEVVHFAIRVWFAASRGSGVLRARGWIGDSDLST